MFRLSLVCWILGSRVRFVFLGWVLLGWAGAAQQPQVALAQGPAQPKLTAEQQKQLQQRDRLWRQAQRLYSQGKLKEAVTALKQVLVIEREIFGEVHEEVLGTLKFLDRLHIAQNDFSSAGQIREQLFDGYARRYGPKDWRTKDARFALADLERFAGMPVSQRRLQAEAEQLSGRVEQAYRQRKIAQGTLLARRCLEMRRRFYPDDQYPQGHPDLANSLNNLGFLLQAQGKYGEARDYFQQALEMRQRLYSQDQYPHGHPDLAVSLNNLGFLLQAQGKYGEARERYQQALKMRLRLYPQGQYPQGHPYLATSLNNLGFVLKAQGEYGEAWGYYQGALQMNQRLYPQDKYPQGHPHIASTLGSLGDLLSYQGEYGMARRYYQQALKMRQLLYPKNQYPHGHPDLAYSLNNLGSLLSDQGEYGEARRYYRQALEMFQLLYPKNQYPKGHPDLAVSLNNLGNLLKSQRKYREARRYWQQALEMRQLLYPKDQYPKGHPYLAQSLNNLGSLHSDQREYGEARDNLHQALEMRQRLYPQDQYPQGHPHLVTSLSSLGGLLQAQGKYGEARDYFQQALEMRQRLYPQDQYPHGHPHLATSLSWLGVLLQSQGNYREAWGHYRQALEMSQNLAEIFLATASVAGALNYLADQPGNLGALLSVGLKTQIPTDQLYAFLWQRKGVIQRVTARRQRMLAAISDDKVRELYRRYLQTRRELARLMLAPTPGNANKANARRNQLKRLTEEKEARERQLADRLPEFRHQLQHARRSHRSLLERLPVDTAVVDLFRYSLGEQDPDRPGKAGWSNTTHYVAFVLKQGEPVVRVELGPAKTIEALIKQWRQALDPPNPYTLPTGLSPAAGELRRLVWEPIADELPQAVRTVYLCADGALTAIPWVALPKGRKGKFLVEEYTLTLLPHAQLLLDAWERQETSTSSPDKLLLTVGGVQYDQRPTKPKTTRLAYLRSPAKDEHEKFVWGLLPASQWEQQAVQKLSPVPVRSLTSTQASTETLAQLLPKAGWAHLATHGFFANARHRSIFQIEHALFERQRLDVGRERTVPGGRNPLVMSGLVLAGANLPRPTDELGIPQGDGGILTAEAIAGLNLQKLELAVLSACDTGLGDVAGGEGVFGLQRAFHTAGTKNIIASLWKVEDAATEALMVEFYRNLWQKKQRPRQALRNAQLAMLHGKLDQEIAKLRKRAPIKQADIPKIKPRQKPIRQDKPASTRDPYFWAAFTLSGAGE